MGLFLWMSGIPSIDLDATRDAVSSFAQKDGHPLEQTETADIEGLQYVLTRSSAGNVLVRLPSESVEYSTLCEHLSNTLDRPILGVHIHDGDFWVYELFVGEEVVDRFNPLPDYWGEVSEAERQRWRGNAETLCKHWPGLDPSSIGKYLTPWTAKPTGKAYPEDRFEYGMDWQVVDFLRKLQLDYPDTQAPSQSTLRLQPAERKLETRRKRWFRFWN